MILSASCYVALTSLRQNWQEDAGLAYPASVMPQLLVLYDVCQCLNLNIFQVKSILGEVGYCAVAQYINAPACLSVNWELVEVLELQADHRNLQKAG